MFSQSRTLTSPFQIESEDVEVEHTLAMIKPEGMFNERKIIAIFKKEGFVILNKRIVHLTPEQASDFYQDHYGRRDFPLLVASTSLAPVMALCLGRRDAVDRLKSLVGPCDVNLARKDYPKTINAQFGNADCNFPAVHASCDRSTAEVEIHFFFPQSIVDPQSSIEESLRFLEREVKPLLKEGLALVAKEKPAEPMLWLAGWLLQNNTNQPRVKEHLRHQHFLPCARAHNARCGDP